MRREALDVFDEDEYLYVHCLCLCSSVIYLHPSEGPPRPPPRSYHKEYYEHIRSRTNPEDMYAVFALSYLSRSNSYQGFLQAPPPRRLSL